MTHNRITASNIKGGMVIMKLGGEYPEAALQVSEWHDGTVTIAPLGGGFVYKPQILEKYEFYEVTEAQKQVPWRQDWMGIDEPPFFKGWHDHSRWNGWHQPYFEKAEADRVAAYFKDDDGEPGKYDPEKDEYVWKSQWEDEDGLDHFPGVDIEVQPNKTLRLYPIGAGYWTWSKTWPDARGLLEIFEKVNADCAADPSLGNVVPYTDTEYYAGQITNMQEASSGELFWDTFDEDDADRAAEEMLEMWLEGRKKA